MKTYQYFSKFLKKSADITDNKGHSVTICIAAACERGKNIILASDSMITSPGLSVQFEHPGRKITSLSHQCMALTAGDALAHTELFNEVTAYLKKLRDPSVSEIVETIKKRYKKIRRKTIIETILAPRGFDDFEAFYGVQQGLAGDVGLRIQAEIDGYNYGLSILIGGISGGKAHIYGITDPGTSQCFDSINFNAIGSGLPHTVNSLIARNCHVNLPLNEALMIVSEAKIMAEKAPGVGKETDMCIMKEDKTIYIPRSSFNDIRDIYGLWVKNDTSWEMKLNALLDGLKENNER